MDHIQIRQGYSLKPTMRGVNPTGEKGAVASEFRDVLSRAWGEEGKTIRRNVEEMSRALREERDGAAKDAIAEFVRL